MGEKVVQFTGKFRPRPDAPVVDSGVEKVAEHSQPAEPQEEGSSTTPTAEEFVGILRGMLDGGLGQGVGGLNRTLVNKSAQPYMEMVRGYSDEEIRGYLRNSSLRNTKPAFYAAIQAVASVRRIF